MHRFHVPPAQCESPTVILPEPEAHHAVHVLRVRPRERVVVLDGVGGEYLCEVVEAGSRGVTLRVAQKNSHPPLPYQVTLLQAIPKGKTMELIVQKATELGVHRIVPILSERVVPQLEAGSVPAKLEKWGAAAIEAIKQCGSAWLPTIEPPVTPQAFLARGERFDLPLIASLQPDAQHPRRHFTSFFDERKRLPRSVGLWIGPEGDFTPSEINAVRAAGALPITLGELVLRSETAAIYGLSVLNYELQSPPG
jgi:16S rRNA (uracil1498-N3)-methyltransferase